jgi:hypothetical protein
MTAENGLYAQDFSSDFSIDENYLPDENGDDVAAAFTNPSGQISLNGFVKTSGTAMSTTLGSALAVANDFAPEDFMTGITDLNDGETLTTSVKRGKKSRDFNTLDITAVFKPYLGAAS